MPQFLIYELLTYILLISWMDARLIAIHFLELKWKFNELKNPYNWREWNSNKFGKFPRFGKR